MSTIELEHIQSRVCGTPIADENNVEWVPVVSKATTAVVQRPPESLSNDLSVEEEVLLTDIKDAVVEFASFSSCPRLVHINFKLAHKLECYLSVANKLISEIPTMTLTETNTLAYTVAYVLTSKVCSPTYRNSPSVIPPWKVRLQDLISVLCGQLSQLDATERVHAISLNNKLVSKYHITERGLSAAKEDAKQRLLTSTFSSFEMIYSYI